MEAAKLGAFIAQLRKETNMTQAELAQKLNVTVQAISKWENAKGLPDINTLEPLAEALGVSVMELMKGQRLEITVPQEELNSATKDIFSFVNSFKKIQTRKFLLRSVITCILFCICLWMSRQIHAYHHPCLKISYATAHNDTIYKTMPTVIIIDESLFGYSKEIKARLQEWHVAVTDMEIAIGNKYETPMAIVNELKVEDDKTYIYYKGFATSKTSGTLETINEVIVFDFVLTENLP